MILLESQMIIKHKIPLIGARLKVPKGSRIIGVHEQNGEVCLWTVGQNPNDDDCEFEDRLFMVVGTGWEVTQNCVYIGTAHVEQFVWHVVEIGELK